MPGMRRSIFVLLFLGSFNAAFAQLPPEIMADKHLIHAKQLHAAKDYTAAFDVMQKIVALQKAHNLTLPDEFHFKYAQVALSADSMRIALESVTRYLSATGKEGEFYKEALALLLRAEGNEVIAEDGSDTAQEPHRDGSYTDVLRTEGTCEGMPAGSSCWMKLTNHVECYVLNPSLAANQTAVWTGKCSSGLAHGEGTIHWTRTYSNDRKSTRRWSGQMQSGRLNGEWITYYGDGSVRQRRLYRDGNQHGETIQYGKDGYISVRMQYKDGKLHGEAVGYYGDGSVSRKTQYKDDKKHGPFVAYDNYGKVVTEGQFENDYEQGQWVYRLSWRREEGPFVQGKKHGQWVHYLTEGGVARRGRYVNDERHGRWVYFHDDGNKSEGEFKNNRRDGIWYEYSRKQGKWSGKKRCWRRTYRAGELIEDKKADKELCR